MIAAVASTAATSAGTPSGTPDSPETAKLKDGANQFEAMMLGEILKPLQFGSSPDGDEEAGGGSANDTIRSFGTEAMAKAIASRGGFGIASLVLRQVSAEHERKTANVGGTKV